MPNFSIKDLLITTTLVAMGLGLIMLAIHEWKATPLPVLKYVLGCSLIGMGLGYPFKKLLVVACFGIFGCILLPVFGSLLLDFLFSVHSR